MNAEKPAFGKNSMTKNSFGTDGSFDCGHPAIEVDAVRDCLQTVIDFVNAHLKQWECPRKVLLQINLAVEEIFINIANYAYPGTFGKARVSIEELKEPAGIRLVFMDQGIPYDPLKKPDPDITLSARERPIGGLGIYLVKKQMDLVEYRYENNCNILTLTKYFSR